VGREILILGFFLFGFAFASVACLSAERVGDVGFMGVMIGMRGSPIREELEKSTNRWRRQDGRN